MHDKSHSVPEPPAPCILIVDDDPQIRGLFRRILEDVGYFVDEAPTGHAALRAVEDKFFDLVILDLSMPAMDGLELLRAIRKELPDIKVLVTSGFMEGVMPNVAARTGADVTLPKITAPERLLTTVCQVLADYFQRQPSRR